MNTFVSSLFKSLRNSPPLRMEMRFREKPDCNLRRYGYKDPVHLRGTLPRSKDAEPIKWFPLYRPKNSWCEKRALFGQNDYIDILGDGTINPVRLLTNVPYWLRGFRGNEYRRLLRKHKAIGGQMKIMQPMKYHDMQKRMKYLWKFFNHKLDLHR